MKYTFILSLYALALPVMASTLTVSKEDVIRLALERNERSLISKANIERANEQISKAKSGLFPTMSMEMGVTRSKATPNLTPYSDNWAAGGTVSLSQPVYTFGRLSAAIELANSQEEKLKNDEIATEASVKLTALSLYYNALFYEAIHKITKESYENALKNEKALRKRVSFGRISRNENLKMQADIASRKPNYIEAEKNYKSSLINLSNFLALEEDVKLELKGNLLDYSKAFSRLKNSSDFETLARIKSLNQNIETSKANEKLVESDYYPSLVAFGSYSPTSINRDFMSDEIMRQENVSFGLKLVFDWPFGGEKMNNVAISRIETKITELNVKSAKRDLYSRYQDLLQQYNNLTEKLEASANASKLALNSYQVALSSFANGTVSQTQLNDSELLLTQNKINYVQNLLGLQLLIAEINEISTKGIDGGAL